VDGPSCTENLFTNAQFDNDESNIKIIFTLFFFNLLLLRMPVKYGYSQ